MHQKSLSICVVGSANHVAALNKKNDVIIYMFVVEIKFVILVFWCPKTVHFVGTSGTEIGGVMVYLEYVETL